MPEMRYVPKQGEQSSSYGYLRDFLLSNHNLNIFKHTPISITELTAAELKSQISILPILNFESC